MCWVIWEGERFRILATPRSDILHGREAGRQEDVVGGQVAMDDRRHVFVQVVKTEGYIAKDVET